MNDVSKMKELIKKLNEASKAYYAQDKEIMSNYEYDAFYDELEELEERTGTVLSGSPTQSVGYEAVDALPKERHESTMLSLAKTKNKEELRTWMQGNPSILSWKLDGLTIVLTYKDGKLAKAVTRGNGEIGEVVTNNAKTFTNLPLTIPFKEELVLRGEAVITYSDFQKINEELPEAEAKYKNPRNLCSGSVRQLNNEITAKRRVKFFAFTLVDANGAAFENSREKQNKFLEEQGFEIVEYKVVTSENLFEAIEKFENKIKNYDVPSDGLVMTYCDLEYGRSLGSTSKFPRDSIAFKWQDEIRETILNEIEWSPSRTGLINPVAIFEPVELEGTTVSRASVHNISIMRSLNLGIGDKITVYKANMIIPQIAENLTKSGCLEIPHICPACGGETDIQRDNEVEVLICTNATCAAKKLKSFTLFTSRDALNIEGLSEATLEKFIAKGFIHEPSDIFHLSSHQDEIVTMEGFGEKSYTNLIKSLEKARKTTLSRFVYSLGIPGIGVANAKMLCKYFENSLEDMMSADLEVLSSVDGIGEVLANSIMDHFANEENKQKIQNLVSELDIEKPVESKQEQNFAGKVFVITGSLEYFENRNEAKAAIEERGGKVTGSVTSKTDYLINNDVTSNSGKNKKAKELEIPIISEEEFRKML